MGNCAAAAYANYGAGRVSTLTAPARTVEEREVRLGRAVVALHIAGRDNTAAGALSRFSIRVRDLDPFPERELRWIFRREVQRRCGAIDVDMLASDDGHNAWVADYRSPSRSAFEGPLPNGRLWWFPRAEIVELVLARIAASMREDWTGSRLVLPPLLPWQPWFPKLSLYV